MKIWVPPNRFSRYIEIGRVDDVRFVETTEIELIEPYGIVFDAEGRSIAEMNHVFTRYNERPSGELTMSFDSSGIFTIE